MVLSIGLSFTKWNALALSDIRPAGLSNYEFVLNEYPPFWPAVQHNVIWLLFLAVVATPLGLFMAVLLDQNIRGSRIYQTYLLRPGDAVAAAGRDHLAADVRPQRGLRSTTCSAPPARPERHRLVRRLEHQPVGRAHRRHLAARRLHHGPVPGRTEGRRSVAARGRRDRRRVVQRRPSSGSSSRRCGRSTSWSW